MSDRRPRKRNFAHDEIIILLSKYSDNKCLLESKFNNFATNKRKLQAWEDITEAINARGVEQRDVKDVRKKWSDLKMQAAEDFPKTVATGGGPKADIGPYSSLVLDILGDDSPSLIGVPGGGIESGTVEETIPDFCPPSPPSVVLTLCAPQSISQATSQASAILTTSPATAASTSPTTAAPTSPTTAASTAPASGSTEVEMAPSAPKRLRVTRGKHDVDSLRCELFSVEIEKVKQETLKIKAEREVLDLEKIKLNLEIIKLQEQLKAQGYTVVNEL